MEVVGHCGFQAAEAEIETVRSKPGAGERDRRGVSPFGQSADDRAARIFEAKHLAHFVKGLPGRIIAGSAQQLDGGVVTDQKDA